jgi:hypothetical protein
MRIVMLLCAAIALPAIAAQPDDFLDAYASLAKQAEPAFDGFSAERGRSFYFREHEIADGSKLSCASCHHADPRKKTVAHKDQIPCRACHITLHGSSKGRSSIKREIKPMAPSANPNRFTNEWQVEAWFDWNCKLLLERECTPQEKGDFITWLLTIAK